MPDGWSAAEVVDALIRARDAFGPWLLAAGAAWLVAWVLRARVAKKD